MADDPGPIKRGQKITAKYLEALRKWIVAGTKIAVEAPLTAIVSGAFNVIRLGGVTRPLYAKLTSFSSGQKTYSWVEVYHTGGASFTPLDGGRTGNNNAFECYLSPDVPVGMNGGSIVELHPGYGGQDWRFQWHRYGGNQPTPCQKTSSMTWCLSVGCCYTLNPVTITLKRHDTGATIGTCTTTGSRIDCYNGSASTQGCTIQFNVGEGVQLDWSFDEPTFGHFSGSFTSFCGDGYRMVTLWSVDELPNDLMLTDPDGNIITISRQGPVGTLPGRQWIGTQSYTRVDSKGAAHGFTVEYEFVSCGLQARFTTFDGNTPPAVPYNSAALGLSCHTDSNYIGLEYLGDNASFNALPNWTAPVDTISLVPLDIAFTQYFNQLHRFGNPTIKRGGCGVSAFGYPFSSPFFWTITGLTGGTWHCFPCTGTWTLTT